MYERWVGPKQLEWIEGQQGVDGFVHRMTGGFRNG
jgi:hypothetical protein